MSAADINLAPLPGAGYFIRIKAWARGLLLRRHLLRLAGIETVTLEGRGVQRPSRFRRRRSARPGRWPGAQCPSGRVLAERVLQDSIAVA